MSFPNPSRRESRQQMTQRSTTPPRAAVLVASAALLGCLLATVLLPAGPASQVSDIAQLLAAAAASTTTARYATHCSGRRVRLAWALVSLACAAWAAGEASWTWSSFRADVVPVPSPADVGFLGFAVLAAAGLLVHPATGGRILAWQRFLDGIMTAAAVGQVSWLTTLHAVVREGGSTRSLESVLLLAYPVSDVLLVVLTVLLLTRTRGNRTALHLMSAGMVALGVADSAFAYLQSAGVYDGGLIDLGWVGGFLLIALAGLSRRRADQASVPVAGSAGPPNLVAQGLPYAPVVVALSVVVGVTMLGRPLNRAEMLAACLVVGCLLGRQFLTVRDNVRLATDLATRERELRHQAFHDPLTGVANRALFQDRLEHALALHARDGRSLAIAFLDLDDFKAVNDSFGHMAGDELLVRVAERITGALRSGDTIARLGGDEFAVLLEDGGNPLGSARRMADALASPFTVAGAELVVRASIGVGCLAAADPPMSADQLLGRSDAAMYAAKRSGKGRIVGFDGDSTTTSWSGDDLREPVPVPG
jgi:diguanylate cyclase (GGDEF)-like protein